MFGFHANAWATWSGYKRAAGAKRPRLYDRGHAGTCVLRTSSSGGGSSAISDLEGVLLDNLNGRQMRRPGAVQSSVVTVAKTVIRLDAHLCYVLILSILCSSA